MGRTVQGRIEDMGAADEPRSYRVDDVTVIVERGTSARERYTRLYRLIALTDVLSIAVALLLAYWVRFGIEVPSGDFLLLLAGAPFAMLVVYGMFHLYDAYRYTAAEEFRRILLAVSLGVGGILALSFWSKGEFSRSWLALSWAFAIVAALASRRLWHAHIGHLKADGELSFPTLIVGTNAEAVHLSTLMERPSFGFRPLGMVATKARDGDLHDLPILGFGDRSARGDPPGRRRVRLRCRHRAVDRRDEARRQSGAARRRRGAGHGDPAGGAVVPRRGPVARRRDGAVAPSGPAHRHPGRR